MRVDILTLFPKMFDGPFAESIIKRAISRGIININLHDIRDYAKDKHRTVDDTPYGGGAGMVMRVDVIDRALRNIKPKTHNVKSKAILLTAQGKVFNQKTAQRFSKLDNIILICGHYEGFDERIRKLVDDEISIGDYILTGGELPAMVLVDSVSRLIPGVLGKDESLSEESFMIGNKTILEYPHYTRPEIYNGMKVPKVLLSGNHQKIADWRNDQAMKRTRKKRPDLLR